MFNNIKNTLLGFLGFLLCAYFTICGVVMAYLSGVFSAGIIFSLIAGIFFFVVTFFSKHISALCKKSTAFNAFCYFVWACVAVLFAFMIFISAFGHNDTSDYTEDAVIVLGAGLKGDKITYPLAYRLDKAVEYSSLNKDAVIVVSGGQGKNETVTEAFAMKKYLVQHGVDPQRIITEDKSTSTSENFAFSKQILDSYFQDNYTCCVITNYFHIFRASLIAKKAGIEARLCGSPIQPYSVPVNYLREVAALIKFALFGY